MKRNILLNNQEIAYDLRRSRRARRMRMTISCEGVLSVTLPHRWPESFADSWIQKKAVWIIEKIDYFRKLPKSPLMRQDKGEYVRSKYIAFTLVKERIGHFNQLYQLQHRKIAIRNQKTRWGSCARNGNLSFNYKIIFLPPAIQDYLVVHELCHLVEFNHSRKFWSLVAQAIPDYPEIRRTLRQMH